MRSNPGFLADSSGVITKQAIDDAYKHENIFPPQIRRYVQELHDSFDYLAADNGTINIHNFL